MTLEDELFLFAAQAEQDDSDLWEESTDPYGQDDYECYEYESEEQDEEEQDEEDPTPHAISDAIPKCADFTCVECGRTDRAPEGAEVCT